MSSDASPDRAADMSWDSDDSVHSELSDMSGPASQGTIVTTAPAPPTSGVLSDDEVRPHPLPSPTHRFITFVHFKDMERALCHSCAVRAHRWPPSLLHAVVLGCKAPYPCLCRLRTRHPFSHFELYFTCYAPHECRHFGLVALTPTLFPFCSDVRSSCLGGLGPARTRPLVLSRLSSLKMCVHAAG